MRAAIVLLLLSVTGPAQGQDFRGFAQARDAQLYAQGEATRNRDIAVTNELSALEARLQTDQALSNLQGARANPGAPLVLPRPSGAPPTFDARQLATIPDAVLAASNARIRAAAANRR